MKEFQLKYLKFLKFQKSFKPKKHMLLQQNDHVNSQIKAKLFNKFNNVMYSMQTEWIKKKEKIKKVIVLNWQKTYNDH